MSDLAVWSAFVARPTWFDRAHCAATQTPVDVFYETNDLSDRRTLHEFSDAELHAKAICNRCDVRAECLAYGLHEPAGIWGGRTARERRRIARLGRNYGRVGSR